VPSFAEEPKEDDAAAAAAAAAATIRSLRSELAVSAAAAEDATAALEAMTLKADTLARLLDEASERADAKDDLSSSQTQNDVQKTKDELRDVSKRLEASESKRAELESAVTRLETRVVSLSNDLSAAREIARSTGELADQSATYIAELKKKHRAVETREKELRAELDLKNAEVRDVRKNTHDSKLETEHYRVEHEKQTSYIATLEKKLKTAEDALEDERVFSERAAVSTLQNELEALREERRALLDASQDFSRRLRDAEDAAADAELRAADAELACEAVRAEAAAELERETEKLRSSDCRRREETSLIAEREKKSSFSRREEDDEDAVVALEDAERRARDAEARARALEAELRARDEAANKTGSAPNPDATKSFSSHSELDEKENETRALRLSLERLTSRAERAERALEAAQLLARPSSVTESDAELVRLRDAGKRAAETERILRETRLKLEACEARVTDEETKRLSAESDARVLMERMNEREARLRLTEARELERTSVRRRDGVIVFAFGARQGDDSEIPRGAEFRRTASRASRAGGGTELGPERGKGGGQGARAVLGAGGEGAGGQTERHGRGGPGRDERHKRARGGARFRKRLVMTIEMRLFAHFFFFSSKAWNLLASLLGVLEHDEGVVDVRRDEDLVFLRAHAHERELVIGVQRLDHALGLLREVRHQSRVLHRLRGLQRGFNRDAVVVHYQDTEHALVRVYALHSLLHLVRRHGHRRVRGGRRERRALGTPARVEVRGWKTRHASRPTAPKAETRQRRFARFFSFCRKHRQSIRRAFGRATTSRCDDGTLD
jgi:archaellum component FlaC